MYFIQILIHLWNIASSRGISEHSTFSQGVFQLFVVAFTTCSRHPFPWKLLPNYPLYRISHNNHFGGKHIHYLIRTSKKNRKHEHKLDILFYKRQNVFYRPILLTKYFFTIAQKVQFRLMQRQRCLASQQMLEKCSYQRN